MKLVQHLQEFIVNVYLLLFLRQVHGADDSASLGDYILHDQFFVCQVCIPVSTDGLSDNGLKVLDCRKRKRNVFWLEFLEFSVIDSSDNELGVTIIVPLDLFRFFDKSVKTNIYLMSF